MRDEMLLFSGCEASAGGKFVSVERILQQESAIIIDDPQSCIICRQHAE